jgi:acetylornithine/N-succinyldiaminopimelate aminotransferase
VLKIIVEEGVLTHGAEVGAYFKEKLLQLKERHPVVEDVRGRGLLIGMKIRSEGEPIVRKCLENGFLINCVQGNILRFIPPLIIERAEIDSLVSCLDRLLGESER